MLLITITITNTTLFFPVDSDLQLPTQRISNIVRSARSYSAQLHLSCNAFPPHSPFFTISIFALHNNWSLSLVLDYYTVSSTEASTRSPHFYPVSKCQSQRRVNGMGMDCMTSATTQSMSIKFQLCLICVVWGVERHDQRKRTESYS